MTVTPVGLGSLPITTLSCIDGGVAVTGVTADITDTAGSALGCGLGTTLGTSGGTYSAICTAYPCTRTFVPSSTTSGTVASVSTTCSIVANSNQPIPTTCYVGTFSLTATGVATAAATSSTLSAFCVV